MEYLDGGSWVTLSSDKGYHRRGDPGTYRREDPAGFNVVVYRALIFIPSSKSL